jgi:hypothetical protein
MQYNDLVGQPVNELDEKEFIYHAIGDDEINQVSRNIVELTQKASNEDAFLIIPVDEDEVRDILFVHTATSILHRYS